MKKILMRMLKIFVMMASCFVLGMAMFAPFTGDWRLICGSLILALFVMASHDQLTTWFSKG
jgi:hypothetical protein